MDNRQCALRALIIGSFLISVLHVAMLSGCSAGRSEESEEQEREGLIAQLKEDSPKNRKEAAQRLG